MTEEAEETEVEPTGDETLLVEVHPWERLPGETSKAYYAFTVYRDMGVRRSLRKAVPIVYPDATEEDTKRYDVSTPPVRQMARWSSAWHWVDRCSAYDRWLENERLYERREAIRQMEHRHSQIAVRAQVRAIEALEALQLNDFTAADIIRFITEGAKLERLARGEATSRDEVTGKGGEPVRVAVTVEQLEDKIAAIIRMRDGAD